MWTANKTLLLPLSLLLLVLGLVATAAGQLELKHSFQAPYHEAIPFWTTHAGAREVDNTFIRLTPDKQSRLGMVWNTVPVTTMSDWEVIIEFQVTGQPKMGADGFAFWFVEQPGMLGQVYGSTDYWNGLGIFFDTFNNDGAGIFPAVVAVLNDGRLKYDHATDGVTQGVGACAMPFRQRPTPSAARIRYQDKTLSLEFELTRGSGKWDECFAVAPIELGVDKYFGLSAQTGDLADNHDIYSFVTTNLSPNNVDVDALRAAYKAKLHSQSKAEATANDARSELSSADFQNQVLDQLNQIQAAVGLVEMSQVAIANLLDGQRDGSVGGGGGGGGGVVMPDGGRLPSVTNTNFGVKEKSDLAKMEESIGKILASTEKLTAAVNSQAAAAAAAANNNGPALGGLAGREPPKGKDRDMVALMDMVTELANTQRDLAKKVAGIDTSVSALARSADKGSAAPSTASLVDDVKRTVEKALSTSPVLTNIANSVTRLTEAVSAGGSGDGLLSGWLGTLVYLVVGAGLGAGAVSLGGRRNNNAYKLP